MSGDPHPVFVDGVPPVKGNARSYIPLRIGTADEVRSLNLSDVWQIFISDKDGFFNKDSSDTTSADDDVDVIVDGDGNRWFRFEIAKSDYESKSDVEEKSIPLILNFLKIAGYYSPGDGGASLYKRSTSSPAEPSHNGKIQSGDGAWWELSESKPNLFMFGAKGDGSTDDTDAIQSAIDYSVLFSCYIYGGFGRFVVASSLTVEASFKLSGAGKFATVFLPDDGVKVFDIDSNNSVSIYDVGIEYGSIQSSGSALSLGAASGNAVAFDFINCRIKNAFNGIAFEASAFANINGCYFNNIANRAIYMQNTFNVDHGDNYITGCSFNNEAISGTTYAIYWNGSGGLRIENNKTVGFSYAVFILLPSGADTSVIKIIGNSLEGFAPNPLVGISITREGTTGSLALVDITGNEFAGWGFQAVAVPTDATGIWLFGLNIIGNLVHGSEDNAASIFDINSTSGFIVLGNYGRSQINNTKFVNTGASAEKGFVGFNQKTDDGSSWASDTISSSTTITYPEGGLTSSYLKGKLSFPTTSVDNTVPRYDLTAGNQQTSNVVIDDSDNMVVPGNNLRIGPTSGGTYNGNFNLNRNDQFPTLQFRSATTIKSQQITDVNSGDYYFDTSGSFFFRDSPNGTIRFTIAGIGIPLLRSYTVSTVPAASSFSQGLIHVSNESGGATPAFSDGTNWRRVADRAIIS